MRPHLQASWQTRSVLSWFVIASIPAAAVGAWNLGWQVLLAVHGGQVDTFGGWRAGLVALADPAAPEGEPLLAVLLGLSYLAPLALVTLSTSALWAWIFARARQRDMDPGWFMSGWLLLLLLPPAVTPLVAALAMSFGAIVGQHIFGGSGRYLVSPALLGVLFVHFSYPAFGQLALPFDSALSPDWPQVVASGIGQEAWLAHLLGTAPGGILGRKLGLGSQES